jgi:hypothetical protein
MAAGKVLHRTTKRILDVVDVLNYAEDTWIRDPDLSAVAGTDSKYWIIEDNAVRPANQAESSAITVTLLAKAKADKNDALWDAANTVNEKYIQGGALVLAYELADRGNETGLAAQNWTQMLWGDYYARKAELWSAMNITQVNNISIDFSIHEPMPTTVGALMVEAVRLGLLRG